MALRRSVQSCLATALRSCSVQRLGFSSAAVSHDGGPITWVFLGPPGVGKGTYATRVADAYNLCHIAAGDLVRLEMKQGSEVGKQMAELVNQGNLLPDALILRVLRERMTAAAAEGSTRFLLDGFPRTAEQAAALEESADVQLALNLDLREEVLVEKCLGRRLCTKCGKNYNVADIHLAAGNGRPEIVMPPLSPPPECAPFMEQRSDDNEETIRRRLEVYKREAAPVEDFYRKQGVLVNFEITGGIPETLPRLLEVLRPYAEGKPARQSAAA